MHEELFANLSKLNSMKIAQITADLNLDLEKFSRDWPSPDCILQIQKDIDEGFARGAPIAPPTFL